MTSLKETEWKCPRKGYRVRLFVYDISAGMAAAMSTALVGKLIDGIWHTSTVVYGCEYFYGGGIQSAPPRSTPYGSPVKEIEMGYTSLTQSLFHDYLQEISPRFSPTQYNLLTHNCNNFSNECVQFLVGSGIPSTITGLPEEVMSTPFGAMIRPMYEQMDLSMRRQLGSAFDEVRPHLPPLSSQFDEFLEVDEAAMTQATDEAHKMKDARMSSSALTMPASLTADTDTAVVTGTGSDVPPATGMAVDSAMILEMHKPKIPKIADALATAFKAQRASHRHATLGLSVVGVDFEPKLTIDPKNSSMYAGIVSKTTELTPVQSSHLNDLVKFIMSKSGGVVAASGSTLNEDCLESLDELILMSESQTAMFGLVSLLRLLCVHNVVFERYRDLTIVEQIVYKCQLEYREELPQPSATTAHSSAIELAAKTATSDGSMSIGSVLSAESVVGGGGDDVEEGDESKSGAMDDAKSASGGKVVRKSVTELLQFSTFGALTNLFGLECVAAGVSDSLLDFAFNAICNSRSFNVRLSVARFLYNCVLQIKYQMLAPAIGTDMDSAADSAVDSGVTEEKTLASGRQQLAAIMDVTFAVLQHETYAPNKYRLWSILGLVLYGDDHFTKKYSNTTFKTRLHGLKSAGGSLTTPLIEDILLLIG